MTLVKIEEEYWVDPARVIELYPSEDKKYVTTIVISTEGEAPRYTDVTTPMGDVAAILNGQDSLDNIAATKKRKAMWEARKAAQKPQDKPADQYVPPVMRDFEIQDSVDNGRISGQKSEES